MKSRIAIGSFIGMIVSVYPILFTSFPVLLQPISAEFGWGRSTLSLALLFTTTTATILYPFVGRALDRWGSRAILLPGFLAFGLAISALSLINGSTTQLFLLYILAGACSTLTAGLAFGRALSRAFESNRGLMLGVCLGVGGGLGAAIMPLYTHWLVEAFGWRGAFLGLALAPLLVGVPTVFFLIHESLRSSGAAAALVYGHHLKEALRSANYWIVLAGIFIVNIVVGGLFGHFVAVASDLHVSSGTAASMLSAASVATLIGQFGIGIGLDRVKTPRLAFATFAAILGGALCIHHAHSAGLLFVGVVLIGLGSGSEYGLLPYFLTRLFGLRSFGQLYGIIYAASAVSYGLGPYVMGWTFDNLHSYQLAFIAFELALALGLALLFGLRRYTYSPEGNLMQAAA
ncbi:MAG: MFS transporter [Gammaproteobacteria bacterium]